LKLIVGSVRLAAYLLADKVLLGKEILGKTLHADLDLAGRSHFAAGLERQGPVAMVRHHLVIMHTSNKNMKFDVHDIRQSWIKSRVAIHPKLLTHMPVHAIHGRSNR
jgi:hypothetical protein